MMNNFKEIPQIIESAIFKAERENSKLTMFQKEIFGLTSLKIKMLLNNITNSLEGINYLEVGTYRGATIVCTISSDNVKNAYGIDNFCYNPYTAEIWNPNGWNNIRHALTDSLERTRLLDKVTIIESDIRDTTINYKNIIKNKINMMFFDIDSLTEKELLISLQNIKPTLDNEFLLIMGNYNNKNDTIKIVNDFLNKNKLITIFHKQIDTNSFENKSSWWNGIGIFALKQENKKINIIERKINVK